MGKNSSTEKKPVPALIADNRKARFDYEILDTVEGGLVLMGSEVKALREGKGNISECYAVITGGEMFLMNSFIGVYSHGGYANHEERRSRKVLLHKREIEKLRREKEEKGLTLVPLKLYWKNGKAKVEIALVRGKKLHDKRATIKEREWNISKQRLLKS